MRTVGSPLCLPWSGVTGREVTPVVSQNKKPLFVVLLRMKSLTDLRDRLNMQVMALSCAASACPCLGFVPNALLIPLTGKYRRAVLPGVLSSIAAFAAIAALVRADLPSAAPRSVVPPAEFVLQGM